VLVSAQVACSRSPSGANAESRGSSPHGACFSSESRAESGAARQTAQAQAASLATAVGHWLSAEYPGTVVPDCEPVLACAPLLSLRCSVGGDPAQPNGASAAPDVRVASFWGCASEPGLRLSVELLCDADPTCVERVVNVVRRSAAAEGWVIDVDVSLRLDVALRGDGAEFAIGDGAAQGLASVTRSVLVHDADFAPAFGSARAFGSVMRHLRGHCAPLIDDSR
jgi:hypothetical protein